MHLGHENSERINPGWGDGRLSDIEDEQASSDGSPLPRNKPAGWVTALLKSETLYKYQVLTHGFVFFSKSLLIQVNCYLQIFLDSALVKCFPSFIE